MINPFASHSAGRGLRRDLPDCVRQRLGDIQDGIHRSHHDLILLEVLIVGYFEKTVQGHRSAFDEAEQRE